MLRRCIMPFAFYSANRCMSSPMSYYMQRCNLVDFFHSMVSSRFSTRPAATLTFLTRRYATTVSAGDMVSVNVVDHVAPARVCGIECHSIRAIKST